MIKRIKRWWGSIFKQDQHRPNPSPLDQLLKEHGVKPLKRDSSVQKTS